MEVFILTFFAGENLCKWYGESCPKNSQCKQHGSTFKCECAPGFLMNKWSECIGELALKLMDLRI